MDWYNLFRKNCWGGKRRYCFLYERCILVLKCSTKQVVVLLKVCGSKLRRNRKSDLTLAIAH